MPINAYQTGPMQSIYQRQQYAKGGFGRWYWDWRDKIVFSYIDDSKDHHILDLGCGEGITLERLKCLYPNKDIVGIDLDPENIIICEQYNLPVKFGDLYSLDISDNCFDVVLFLEVLEHLHHPDLALKEIKRILRPGGKIITLFPYDFNFYLARLATLKFKEAGYDPGHLCQWTPKKVTAALKPLGFSVTSTRNIPFYFRALSLHGLVVATNDS